MNPKFTAYDRCTVNRHYGEYDMIYMFVILKYQDYVIWKQIFSRLHFRGNTIERQPHVNRVSFSLFIYSFNHIRLLKIHNMLLFMERVINYVKTRIPQNYAVELFASLQKITINSDSHFK